MNRRLKTGLLLVLALLLLFPILPGSSLPAAQAAEEIGDTAYALTSPPNVDSLITSEPDKVIADHYSLYAKSSSPDWREFLHSDSGKLPLLPGNSYLVTFKYRIAETPQNYAYFFAYTPSGGNAESLGWAELEGEPGEVHEYSATIDLTTSSRTDYHLVFGLRGGGAVSIDDIAVKRGGVSVDKESFEPEAPLYQTYLYAPSWPGHGVVTDLPEQVIDGLYALRSVSDQGAEWVEFLHSDPVQLTLEASQTYTVRFQYRALQPLGDYLYFFAKSDTGGEPASASSWQTWEDDAAAQTYTVTKQFQLGPHDDYRLIWGIRGGGAVSVDNIEVYKGGVAGKLVYKEGFEPLKARDFDDTPYQSPWGDGGFITANKSKVLNGSYSVTAKTTTGVEWNEVLHSVPSELPLAEQGEYFIEFDYRIIRPSPLTSKPANEKYFYFFAYSPTGSAGWTPLDEDRDGMPDNDGTLKLEGAPGYTYHVEHKFKLGNYNDYRLVWGIRNGGEISIDSIKLYKDGKLISHEDFERLWTGDYSGTYLEQPETADEGGRVTGEAGLAIYGSRSLAAEGKAAGPVEIARTDSSRFVLQAGESYTVRFKYKVIGAGVDVLFEACDGACGTAGDRGATTATAPSGLIYDHESTFTLGASDDYRLHFFVDGPGTAVIDDLVVVHDGLVIYREDFEPRPARDFYKETLRLDDDGALSYTIREAETPLEAIQAEELYGSSALTGAWDVRTYEWAAMNRTLHLRSKPSEDSTLTLGFNGTGIRIYGMKFSWVGQIGYSIDNGAIEGVIDGNNDLMFTAYDELLSVTGLSPGNHTLKLTSLNDETGYVKHNSFWKSWDVWLDYIEVIDGSVIGPGLGALGGSGWTEVTGGAYHNGKAARISPGGELRGTFIGDSLEVYALKEPGGGEMTVYLDDVPHTVSLNSGSAPASVQQVFSFYNIPRGNNETDSHHMYRIAAGTSMANVDYVRIGRKAYADTGRLTLDVPSYPAGQRLAAVAVQAVVPEGSTLQIQALDAGQNVLVQTEGWLLDMGAVADGAAKKVVIRLTGGTRTRSPEIQAVYLLAGRSASDTSEPDEVLIGPDTGTIKETKETLNNGIGNFVWLPKRGYLATNGWQGNSKIDILVSASQLQAGGTGFMVSQRRGLGDIARPAKVTEGWVQDTTPDIFTEEEVGVLQSIGGNYFLGLHAEEMDISMVQGALRQETREDMGDLYNFATDAAGRAKYEAEIGLYADRYQSWGTEALVNSALTYQHATYRAGADWVIGQLQEHMVSGGVQLAYLRGASYQFDKPFGTWLSLWFDHKVPTEDPQMIQYQNQWGIGNMNTGYSVNEMRRSLFLAYYSGSRMLVPQDGITVFTDKGRDGDWQPSLWAQEVKAFHAYADNHRAGSPVKRVAIMTDLNNGYTPSTLWQGWPSWMYPPYDKGNPIGQRWGLLPAERPEESQRETMKLLYPGSENSGGLFKYPGVFTSTPYGPVDVVASDIAPEKLAQYDGVVLMGRFLGDQGLFDKLKDYVEGGGWLYANASQFTAYGQETDFWGGSYNTAQTSNASATTTLVSELSSVVTTDTLPQGQSYAYASMSVTAPSAAVIAKAAGGDPVAVRNIYGSGKVFLSLTDYDLNSNTFPAATMLPSSARMIGAFTAQLNSAEVVVGGAEGLEYLPFRQADGKPGIVLVNHRSDVSLSVSLRWPGAASANARDIVSETDYTLQVSGSDRLLPSFAVAPGQVAVLELD
ncbi:hypothetical protein [Paenibacillus agaridevorans]|uniref:hypothetical protein n=1 Tax=Paenibacillus agaridevorans TaxID=171404 RepID=UPI001BE4AB89|nr:hypothetical protein [Paenibacillus agaridevorans]